MDISTANRHFIAAAAERPDKPLDRYRRVYATSDGRLTCAFTVPKKTTGTDPNGSGTEDPTRSRLTQVLRSSYGQWAADFALASLPQRGSVSMRSVVDVTKRAAGARNAIEQNLMVIGSRLTLNKLTSKLDKLTPLADLKWNSQDREKLCSALSAAELARLRERAIEMLTPNIESFTSSAEG